LGNLLSFGGESRRNATDINEDSELFAGGDTQQRLLSQLLDCKSGLTIDEISARLEISRSAVKQHLTGLERNGFVARNASRKTGGRPGNLYVLTDAGIDSFPKQYSWFSRIMFERLRSKIGPGEFGRYMFDLGVDMSAAAIPRLVGKTRIERIIEIVKIMNETGFAARVIDAEEGDKLPRIECKNCVYHDLSKDYIEVCQFDIGFISGLMGADIDHQECMQRGGQACRFRFKPLA
jgi:DeoR family transcriptional regulator, suf operon transcriptional repressor